LEKRKDDFNILLSLSWNSIDTIQFKDILKKKLDMWININFIIWWAFGLNEADVLNVDYKLHLSKMTFPHAMALLILLEQIYRSIQLINGRQYHY
jgi:23S rRNA (pseudouridine1915-N3)-methyltransferase